MVEVMLFLSRIRLNRKNKKMNYTKIKTQKQYKEYMIRFEKIFLAKIGTKEGDEAEALALVIKEYEDRTFPLFSSVK